jgi:hypothetical protein
MSLFLKPMSISVWRWQKQQWQVRNILGNELIKCSGSRIKYLTNSTINNIHFESYRLNVMENKLHTER